MPNLDRAIEAIIKNAIDRGVFDNLRGQGKPLNLHENQMVAKEWRMAFSLLEQEGFALPWMETRKEIEGAYKRAQESLARTWQWKQEQLAKGDPSPLVEGEWRQAAARFSETAATLNKKIDAYNLSIPADVFYRPRINVEREIEKISH